MVAGRPLLKTIMALGCVVSLAGVTGVFAVFTDRAMTGTNSFESEDLGRAADLQLAFGEPSLPVDCGGFDDHLLSDVLSIEDVPAGQFGATEWMCIRNVGSSSVGVTATVIDATDVDTGCTGDEATEDPTCGGDQAGELYPRLVASITTMDCVDNSSTVVIAPASFASLSATPVPLFTLAPSSTMCVHMSVTYAANEAQAQVSQSDTVTWRFAFDGTTAP
ncbi:MAG: SipW-dependent-type signal peptide-containing protein [Acidimicrobiales bacterium]